MRTIGFETVEVITIGLVNITRCEICGRRIHYNGIMPRFCFRCRPSPEADPGSRSQRDQKFPGEG
jgi:hypothetical protein